METRYMLPLACFASGIYTSGSQYLRIVCAIDVYNWLLKPEEQSDA